MDSRLDVQIGKFCFVCFCNICGEGEWDMGMEYGEKEGRLQCVFFFGHEFCLSLPYFRYFLVLLHNVYNRKKKKFK